LASERQARGEAAQRFRLPLVDCEDHDVGVENISVERNVIVVRSQFVFRQPLGQKLFSAGGDKLRALMLNVEWLFFQRLEDDFVADFADPHFLAGKRNSFGRRTA
jgi:hypothetical protein